MRRQEGTENKVSQKNITNISFSKRYLEIPEKEEKKTRGNDE